MQVSNPNNIKIYNLSAGKSLPEWLSDRRKRALQKNDTDIRRRIQLIQDFEMPTVSNCISISNDGRYIFATGVYKPRVRCYDVAQMSMKFERCMDSEVIRFLLLADDYTKIVFLQTDRYVEFHNQNGRYYRTRLPMYGRDFVYHQSSAELYFVGTSSEITRINLELGKFMMPVKSDAGNCELNCCDVSDVHNLIAVGTSLGHVACFDPRTRNRVSFLDCTASAMADNADVEGLPMISTVKFKDHLNMAVGTSTGQILLYDLRSSRPLLVKDHNFGLPIKDIEFHQSQNLVLSCDSRILKIWDEHTGKAWTSVEPTDTKLNDLCVVCDTGMLFLANEAPKILTYYIPSLGPAPKWCSFLDSLTEELEENPTPSVYDDYKFLTRSELDGLGLSHLIGTDFVRAYMHGFFLDIRLYRKAKSVSDEFVYDEYRQRKIREKIDEKIASRVKTKKLPKVNKELAQKLLELEKAGQKKKKKPVSNLLHDERFSRMFTDVDFQVDVLSEEYRLLNPVISKMEKRLEDKQDQDEGPDFEDVARMSEDSTEEDDDDDDTEDEGEEMSTPVQQQERLQKVLPRRPIKHRSALPVASAYGGRTANKKTLGELCEDVEVVRSTDSTFGNLEMTFKLNKKKSESKQLMETKRHREERKKVRRSATKLATKKPPKFWMGRNVRR